MNATIPYGGNLPKEVVMANVVRWRKAHGLTPKGKFQNSPRIVAKKPVTIDVVAKVEVLP